MTCNVKLSIGIAIIKNLPSSSELLLVVLNLGWLKNKKYTSIVFQLIIASYMDCSPHLLNLYIQYDSQCGDLLRTTPFCINLDYVMKPFTTVSYNLGQLQRNLIQDTELLFSVLLICIHNILSCLLKSKTGNA